MAFYDIFNGDADGLCALQQLRLAQPREAELITGVKRDIRLLERVRAQPGDEVTVLYVSLAENREGILALLDAGSLDEAVQAAERLRASIAAAPLGGVPVTISVGVAGWPADVAFARALARADVALYEAKRAGRDRVVLDVEPAGGRRAGEAAG